MATSSALAAAAAEPIGFVDVPPSHTFFAEVVWLKEAGITLGCNPPDNTHFCPAQPVTRGQMAAFLTRALTLTEDGGYDWFTDDNTNLFESDINKIAQAGITFGCNPPDNTHFCPAQPVTRGEMAGFLFRALGGESVLIGQINLTVGLATEEPIYTFDLVDFEYLVENTGTDSLTDVLVESHACLADAPVFVVGDSDGLLEPAEVWSFVCPDQLATDGYHEATAQAVDSVGTVLTATGSTFFATSDAVETSVTPSASVVAAGETVVWTFRVANVGNEALWHVSAEGRMIVDGSVGPWPFFPMGTPTDVGGNGDDMFDPGEVWEWYDSKVMTADAYYHADFAGEPWYSDGGLYGFSAVSEVVTVTGS